VALGTGLGTPQRAAARGPGSLDVRAATDAREPSRLPPRWSAREEGSAGRGSRYGARPPCRSGPRCTGDPSPTPGGPRLSAATGGGRECAGDGVHARCVPQAADRCPGSASPAVAHSCGVPARRRLASSDTWASAGSSRSESGKETLDRARSAKAGRHEPRCDPAHSPAWPAEAWGACGHHTAPGTRGQASGREQRSLASQRPHDPMDRFRTALCRSDGQRCGDTGGGWRVVAKRGWQEPEVQPSCKHVGRPGMAQRGHRGWGVDATRCEGFPPSALETALGHRGCGGRQRHPPTPRCRAEQDGMPMGDPIRAPQCQGAWWPGDRTLWRAFPPPHLEHHPSAVDGGDRQRRAFLQPQTAGGERGEAHAVPPGV